MGVVRITNVLRKAECSPVSSLGDRNLTEFYLGYNYKLNTDPQSCTVGKELLARHLTEQI